MSFYNKTLVFALSENEKHGTDMLQLIENLMAPWNDGTLAKEKKMIRNRLKIDRLRAQLSVLKVKNDQHQKHLIAFIGSEAYSQLKNACLPSYPSEKTFEEPVTYLDAIYSPRRLVVSDRFKFNECCQSPGESVQEFITTLKKLASHCEFDTFLDDALRDRLIVGPVDEACQRELLGEPSLTFQKACEKALDSELVKNQSGHIKNKSQVNWIAKNYKKKPQSKTDQFKKNTSAVPSSSQ
ncbi:hypothetical protein QTP88_001737 [Uroleucon formosanum]